METANKLTLNEKIEVAQTIMQSQHGKYSEYDLFTDSEVHKYGISVLQKLDTQIWETVEEAAVPPDGTGTAVRFL